MTGRDLRNMFGVLILALADVVSDVGLLSPHSLCGKGKILGRKIKGCFSLE